MIFLLNILFIILTKNNGDQEGLPNYNTQLEAMAMELPILSKNMVELLKDLRHHFLRFKWISI